MYHSEVLLLQNAEAVAQLSYLFLSKVRARMIGTLLKQKLQDWCFQWLFQILNNTYFVELLRTAVSEKQMNYWFNIKMVLLKTLLTIYPKNEKQNILIKVCKIGPTPLTPFFVPRHPRQNFNPCHPRQNFTHPRYARQNLTHATQAPILPTPPMRFSRLCENER